MFSFYLFSVPQGLMFNGQQKSSLYCSEEGAVVFLGLWIVSLWIDTTTELLRVANQWFVCNLKWKM